MVWEGLLIEPADKELEKVTEREADPGVATRYTVPLVPVFHVTYICGSGVPLLEPLITPPVTLQSIDVVASQDPIMAYWYCTPGTTQVGPVILTWAFAE
ncbi:MAG: hypothetical protein NVSMB63_12690 [Sediminibacterium sp.]